VTIPILKNNQATDGKKNKSNEIEYGVKLKNIHMMLIKIEIKDIKYFFIF